METDRMVQLDQVFVVVKYSTSREYGGAEEGGWWFTDETFDKVVTAHSYEYQALRARDNLNTATQAERDGGFHYRVVALPWWDDDPQGEACHRDSDAAAEPVLRTDIPQHFPEHRPHYC